MAISDWLRALWKPTAQPPLEAAAHPEVALHVARAEEAYDRMVEARDPKVDHDAAQQHFGQAIAAAQRLGLGDQAARLTARRDAVAAHYASQAGRAPAMIALPRALLALLIVLLPAGLAADPAPPPTQPEPVSLRGQLLIASPQMGDPRFAHTVILMVRHEAGGALGIVLNRPFEERSVASLLTAIGRPAEGVTGTIRVFVGGPVEPGAGFIVHSAEYRGGGGDRMEIDGRLAVSLDPGVLADIGHGKGPAKSLFALGYAGWGPGQLEGEMARRDWFTAPASARLVFDEDREKLWDVAMAQRTRDL